MPPTNIDPRTGKPFDPLNWHGQGYGGRNLSDNPLIGGATKAVDKVAGVIEGFGNMGDRMGAAQSFADANMQPGVGSLYGFNARSGATWDAGNAAQGRGAPQAGRSGFRQDQRQAIGMLQGLASGQGPSAANMQLQDSLRRNVSAQQALAASARPGESGAAQRMASQQASLLGGSLANQGANARVQEQLGAMGMLGNAIQGARGQDESLNLANVQAQLQQRGMNDQQQQAMYQQNLQNAIAAQQGGLGAQNARNSLLAAGLNTPTPGELQAALAMGGLESYLNYAKPVR